MGGKSSKLITPKQLEKLKCNKTEFTLTYDNFNEMLTILNPTCYLKINDKFYLQNATKLYPDHLLLDCNLKCNGKSKEIMIIKKHDDEKKLNIMYKDTTNEIVDKISGNLYSMRIAMDEIHNLTPPISLPPPLPSFNHERAADALKLSVGGKSRKKKSKKKKSKKIGRKSKKKKSKKKKSKKKKSKKKK
jgi:hypothetical protein